jgi:hypothetical protein
VLRPWVHSPQHDTVRSTTQSAARHSPQHDTVRSTTQSAARHSPQRLIRFSQALRRLEEEMAAEKERGMGGFMWRVRASCLCGTSGPVLYAVVYVV